LLLHPCINTRFIYTNTSVALLSTFNSVQLGKQLEHPYIPSDTTRDVQEDHQQYSTADTSAWNEGGGDVRILTDGKFNGPLPVGWEMRMAGGQLAFFDRKSGETTTVNP
jgi:hypothetical protein